MRLAALLVMALLAGCKDDPKPGGGGPGGRRGAMEFPVEAAPIEAREVEYEIRADGTLDVFERVQVTARVAGVVEKVSFREGQAVKAGQVLVTIDPDRFALAARQAQAAVASTEAALKDAEAGLERRVQADAKSPGVIPAEEISTWRTKVDTARAAMAEKQLAVDRAKLDRRDAFVRAPVAGVVQTRDASTGMYAQPGTLLATLVQREPLLLRFDVAETEAARIPADATVQFKVDGDERTWEAKVTHVAEVADPRSRMVRVTAEVTSEKRGELRAGGFAQVVVPVGSRKAAAVIPELAIRPSERGFLVFVVVDGVAQERTVELGLRTADGMVEVRRGVEPGELLVVRGAEALRDGAKVKIVPRAQTPGAQTPGAGAGAGAGTQTQTQMGSGGGTGTGSTGVP